MNKRQHNHKISVQLSQDRKAIRKSFKKVYPTMKMGNRWREIRHAIKRELKIYVVKGIFPENITDIIYQRCLEAKLAKRSFLK